MSAIVSIPVEPIILTDLRKRQLVLFSDTPVQQDETISGTLEVVPFLREDEEFLISDDFLERARELNAMWGLRHAEAFLRDPQFIPQAAEGFYIPFPGTILQRRAGRRCIGCLGSAHIPARWYLFIADLDGQFFRGGRFLRLSDKTQEIGIP